MYRFLLAGVFFCVIAVHVSAQDSSSPNTSPAIQAMKESLATLRHTSLRITSQVTGEVMQGNLDAERHTSMSVCGDKKKIATEWIDSSNTLEGHYRTEFIIQPRGQVLSAQWLVDDAGEEVPSEDGNNSIGLLLSDSTIAPGQNVRDQANIYSSLDESAFPLGYYGYSPLEHYLTGTIVREDRVDGLVEMQIDSEYGSLELTLDPQHGSLPTHIQLTKNRDDIVVDGPVRTFFNPSPPETDVPLIDPGPMIESPENEATQMQWDIEFTEFKQLPTGDWYPSQSNATYRVDFANQPSWVTHSSLSVSELSPEDATCDFTVTFPEGTSVSIEGAYHLPYRWDGKAAVPGVPDLPDGGGYDEEQQRNSKWVYLFIFNAIAILVVIILFARARLFSTKA